MKKENLLIAAIILLSLVGIAALASGEDSPSASSSSSQTGTGLVTTEIKGVQDETTPGNRPGMDKILGTVTTGKFQPVKNPGDMYPQMPLRLTHIAMQEAVSPESGELDLSQYEGKAIMVEGLNGGGWMYDVEVIDVAGPILTEVVKRMGS